MHIKKQCNGSAARRQRRDAQENRQLILNTAKRLFAGQGVDQTTMHEIARAAGVGQGTLYRHFSDKSDLCQALIKEDIAEFQERVGALISDATTLASPLARLDFLIEAKIALTESHLPLFAAIEESASGARRTRPFRGPFHSWLRERIISLLAEAVEREEAVELDEAVTADIILAATAPPLYAFQRQELGYDRERIVAAMRRLFIEGVRR